MNRVCCAFAILSYIQKMSIYIAHVACVRGNYRWSCVVHVPWNHFRIFWNPHIWYAMISLIVILFRHQKRFRYFRCCCLQLSKSRLQYLFWMLPVGVITKWWRCKYIFKRVSEANVELGSSKHLSLYVWQFVPLSGCTNTLMIKHLNLIFTT